MSSSSSSSAAKPSSSSSSSSRPSGSSSSSSSRPSSSSSGSGSSGSGGGTSPPQPIPVITANAWMSFFLFCCLVLIILQGPLGLTGPSNILPTFGLNGYSNVVGGMPGCIGVVSNYVPWCQQQQQQYVQPVIQPQEPQAQIQVQQVIQNSNGGNVIPGRAYINVPPNNQMGGQGGFATPNGGGGWSWYSNSNNGQVLRPQQPIYYQSGQSRRERTVRYQRPGLQIQVNNARGSGGGGGVPVQQSVIPYYNNRYSTCPNYHFHHYGHGRCTPWQPWNCQYLPNIFAYAQNTVGNGGDINIQSQHVGSSGQYQAQSLGQPQHIPVQPIPVTAPPQTVIPPGATISSISNLENAFYPLLVGAIALLIVFDYAT
ncbi:uncharacterized protein L201_007095 [Kwoniella dendrophila CBS 6074]|uniref:Uncharacterized protein n=1 Tax=Kwoniella dendrophila CBS 6074 TaxID=1295534 RepID=A0AAX4K360_9TREE